MAIPELISPIPDRVGKMLESDSFDASAYFKETGVAVYELNFDPTDPISFTIPSWSPSAVGTGTVIKLTMRKDSLATNQYLFTNAAETFRLRNRGDNGLDFDWTDTTDTARTLSYTIAATGTYEIEIKLLSGRTEMWVGGTLRAARNNEVKVAATGITRFGADAAGTGVGMDGVIKNIELTDGVGNRAYPVNDGPVDGLTTIDDTLGGNDGTPVNVVAGDWVAV